MSYSFYLGDVRLPVAPAVLDIRYPDKIGRVNLASGQEIVLSKSAGLVEIGFTALLPQTVYPFAQYDNKFVRGGIILRDLLDMKESGEPFRFIILRRTQGSESLDRTNIKVVFSHIFSREDAGEGSDISVDIKLVEFRDIVVGNVRNESGAAVPSGGTLVRSVDTSPPVSNTYTVVKGDSMWLIAHRFWGDGSRYKELYNMNKSVVDAGNKGTGNPVYTIYPGQVFRLS